MGRIHLETLGIEVTVEGHEFRNDGAVDHVWGHKKKVYEEFDKLDDFYSWYGRFADILPDDVVGRSTGSANPQFEKDGTTYHIAFYKKADSFTTVFLRGYVEAVALIHMGQRELLEQKLAEAGFDEFLGSFDDHFIANLTGLHTWSRYGIDISRLEAEKMHPDLNKALSFYQQKERKPQQSIPVIDR